MTAAKTTGSPGAPPLAPHAQVGIVLHPAVGEDWPADGLGPVEPLAAQLPDPAELAPGAWVAISPGRAGPPSRLWDRLLGRRPMHVHLAVRCTALLARGYAQVCADLNTAYGQAPPR